MHAYTHPSFKKENVSILNNSHTESGSSLIEFQMFKAAFFTFSSPIIMIAFPSGVSDWPKNGHKNFTVPYHVTAKSRRLRCHDDGGRIWPSL